MPTGRDIGGLILVLLWGRDVGAHLVSVSRLVLEGGPRPPVLAVGQLVGADKLAPPKVLSSLGDDRCDVGGSEQVHLGAERARRGEIQPSVLLSIVWYLFSTSFKCNTDYHALVWLDEPNTAHQRCWEQSTTKACVKNDDKLQLHFKK